MKKYLKFIVILLLLSGASMSLYATSYYVDKDASGSNYGTSWSNAWTSFSDIDWSVFSPGDVLYISGGSNSKTYHEMLYVKADGSSQSHIIITKGNTAGHNGKVILDGQMNIRYGVRIKSRKYITVKNLTVKNFSGSGQIRVRYSTGVVIDNNEIYATGHGGVYLHSNTNTVVKNNRITTPSNSPAQTDGIYSQLNTNNIYERNHIVIYNQDNDPHCDGIQMYKDTGITVRNNYIEQTNNKIKNAQGIYTEECFGTIKIYNNVVYAPNSSNSLLCLANYSEGNATLHAYHNTLVGGKWGTLWLKDSPGSIIKNNILVCYKSSGWLIKLEGSRPAGSNINNNIYYAPNSQYVATNNSTMKSWSQWSGYGFEINGMNGAAKFFDVSSRNFELLSDSPAINRGTALSSSYSTDKSGVSRPQGSGWDIGAYEFVGMPQSLEPPQNLRAKIIY